VRYHSRDQKGKKIMTDTQASQATKKLLGSVQETSKALADTLVAAQERNLAFAQSVLENSIEVLRSHAESSRTLIQELVEQAKKQQVGPEGLQAVVDSAIAAQERNAKLAQGILENGIEVLKSQVGVTHSLIQELGQQYQNQQEAFQALAQQSMEAYREFLFAPLTFFQKAVDAAEATTREGIKNFQQMSQQGMEQFQKATRQAASATEKAARAPHNTTSKTAN
jgi:predicted nucleic acid-binding protein